MEDTGRVVRMTFLDFRKAYDLIDHNKLLKTFTNRGVGPALVRWFASYLQDRSQMSTFHHHQSDCKKIKGGIPQGSKLGPVAFILKINQLPLQVGNNFVEVHKSEKENKSNILLFDLSFRQQHTSPRVCTRHS